MYPPPPPHSDYDKVELVWPGKTTEVERVSLPFQTIERVNEVSRSAGGQARLRDGGELPGWWPEGWRNKLIWGDNKYVLSSLLDEFAGKVDLIYIDPPFDTGDDFSYKVQIGSQEYKKLPSLLEEHHFRDTWHPKPEAYLSMMRQRLVVMRDLLTPTGSIFVHVDWHVAHYMRLLLDECFGPDAFRNELIWWYYNKLKGPANQFARAHDNILWYSKGHDWKYTQIDEPREKPTKQLVRETDPETGNLRNARDEEGNVMYRTSTTRRVDTVWRIPMLQPADKTENTGYRTQKRVEIVKRIIMATSDAGDLVMDAFAGSGTTAVAADQAKRRWICVDVGRHAIQTARKRLLKGTATPPFEVLNLGKYERSQWQGADVGEQIGEYYDFIIQLYGATRLDGFNHLHGIKGDRMIHVGATDAPVTEEELGLAISECAEGSTLALDVLGWEWEMGLNPSRKDELAHFYEVDVHLLNIPREVMDQKAVEAGDIHFFELSVVELEHAQDDRGLVVEITNFLPAVDHYMAEKVGDAISRWSDWIDYWSIDFEYDGETFINSWQSYRTRQDRSLSLTSDPHRYDTPGKKTIVVKVIDIFGNDTTRELTVEVE